MLPRIDVKHALIACGYIAGATLVAVVLVLVSPGSALGAIAFGVAVAAGAGVAHLALLGQGGSPELRPTIDALRERIDQLTARQETIDRELAQARSEARQIYDALAEAGRAGGSMKDVMAEVRLLHRLVEQMRDTQPPAALPRAAPAPRPAPAVEVAPPSSPAERSMLDLVQDALSAGRVDLVLQPIVTLPQRRRRFYECFSRIRNEAGEVILPEQYLDTAASIGLLPAMDNLLLFRCIQMIRRARQRDVGIGFFCNISRHSLADRDFLREVAEFLEDNRDLAQNIVLETAQASVSFDDVALKLQIDRLAEIGVRFSLDNVTELPLDYARLAEWHVKFVKIPAERFADTDPQGPWEGSLFQLRRMLGLHGIELIVEKIETDRQLLELLEFNISFGQGYLFGEPKPAPEA